MKMSIVIPAYNEEKRIAHTLQAYDDFLKNMPLGYEIVVVVNGTTDATMQVVQSLQASMPHLLAINSVAGGKGLAIARGFKDALTRENDLIGFVDADMATSPQAYYQLIEQINGYDGIIASRYMPGASVTPARPFVKRWGSKIFFETLTKLLLGINYYDTQCGAKLFKRETVEKIAPFLSVPQWAFDIELLYLCKRFNFRIKEQPTVWHDKAGSKLRMMRAGSRMLATLFALRWRYWWKSLG